MLTEKNPYTGIALAQDPALAIIQIQNEDSLLFWSSQGIKGAARKELQRLERQLERLSAREAELAEQLAANATDYEKLTALGADLRTAQAEKADAEERWLTLAAELET